MEKNGELDSSFMAVDPVSPASNNSKEVSDEPAAPRRNSIDDNDPSRPRKRLAAMAIYDDADNTKQVLPAKDEQSRGEPESKSPRKDQAMEHKSYNGASSKPDEAALEDELASSPSTVQGTSNKITIHLRTPRLTDLKEDGLEETVGDDENDGQDQLTPTSSEPPLGADSLQGDSPTGSLCSPEIEVEEVEEMEEDDDLAGHITIVDDYVNNPIALGGTVRAKEIMDTVLAKLERDPSPLRQLEELISTMSSFVDVVGDQIENFYKLYLVNQDIWPGLPGLIDTLMKRTEPFAPGFFRKQNGTIVGLESIVRVLVEFSRLSALIVRYDVSSLEHVLPDMDITPLSWAYQRSLSLILRPNQLFALLHRNYNFNMVLALPRVIGAFIDTHNGLESLRKFGDLILQRVPVQPKLLVYTSFPLDICAKLIRCLELVGKDEFAPDDWSDTQDAVSDVVLRILTSVENLLASLLETHIQLLIIKDFNTGLNSLCTLVGAFYGMNAAEPRARSLIQEKIGNSYGDIDINEFPSLAEWACRFPFLLKMLTSNRMDFRLQGLIRATELLVGAWREYCGSSNNDWHDSTLLRFLAHFIIDNKVVEYIMGPESHHELIRRSANITGFLIVTSTTTPEIRHALWQPVVNNKDPRIVQATLAMHQDMIPNMSIQFLVELSKRVRDIPFSSFDSHMMELVSRLLEAIKTTFYQQQQVLRLDPAPYEMLIRLIRMASHEEENATPSGGLPPSVIFESAGKELMTLAEYGPAGSLRREIFHECIRDIKEMNTSATGSINVIQAFLQQRPRTVRPGSPGYAEDIEYLIKELNLAELLVNEIARFVDSHSEHDHYSTLRRLKARLELLQIILHNSPECLTPCLGKKLWTYLVGEKALGTSERDHGFEFYINYSTKSAGQVDPILDSVFRLYFPALDPAYFSPHVLNFCIKSIEYLNKPTGLEDAIDEESVTIEGVEQLWRIILKAPTDRLAAEATTYFVDLYLDSRVIFQRPAKVVEVTHFKIVERCINQLTSAASKNDNTNTNPRHIEENKMSIDPLDGRCNTQEFFRSLDLLDHFVKGYKTRSRYNQGLQDSNQASTVDMITGVTLTLRLRWHGLNYQSPIHTFKIGNLDTGQDLHDRITKLVGGDKYRLILAGRELKLVNEPLKTLKDFGIPDNSFLQVSKTPDQDTPTANPSVFPSNLNALQVEVMRHFDSLYELLCLSEPQATKIWNFLRNFPVDEHIKTKMVSGPSWFEIFPAEHPYKTLYSLHALRICFEEQKQQQGDEKSLFISKATLSLLETLIKIHHESKESYSINTRAQVTNELLECLRIFLQERAAVNGSLPSFTNAEGFVQRIFEILRVCSEPEYAQCSGSEPCVANAFNVLLMASKIDPKIWSSLIQKSELIYFVDRFLLRDERQKVRLGTGEAIVATFNRPSRSEKPTTHDFARFFWDLLKEILQQDSLDSNSSAEMFQTALLNFKFLGETDPGSLDLEVCFDYWSSRLRTHKVTEVVGCSNEDFVVTGFAKLLTRGVNLARNRGVIVRNDVSEEIFRNLLFPPISGYSGNSELIERLPCLHGPTRSEIYNLLVQLANDPESCARMIRLNHRLFPKDQALHDGFHADRGRWARSIAGHVGLQNMSNTCYLNSLMAQLFMNRSFRAFVLEMPIDPMDDSQKLLYFMKVLFARMQNSYTKAVEPKDFVEAITDYEGEQIDIAIQMDVDEFFNLIFDRLEGQMPSMELKSSFRSHYGGQLVQQVKSNECPHISERTEPFSAIQCDIKGKSTLQESLKAYVEGEIMDGDNKYSCTTCDRHVDAVKRTCLKDIPDHLIFHLKRFEFDLQTMHRSKINDCFEFPTSIDMRPYTKEYLGGGESNGEKLSADMFELVGVLVHSGTAESGHYYSYIRNRLSPSGSPEWFEFNDSEVSSFDPSTIPAACYGGTDGVTRDAMGQTYTLSKPYSAYMLFYERSSLLSSSAPNQGAAPTQAKLSIPRELEIEIHKENEYFIRKYCMFDNNHIEFVRRLLDQQQRLIKHATHLDHAYEKKALLLGLDTLEQIATRFKDSTEGEALFNVLNTYLIQCPECCLEFFDWLCEKEEAITNLLVCNPYAKARGNFMRLVMFALTQVRRKRPELYGPTNENDSGDHETDYEETVLHKLCSSLMRSWNGLQWSIKTWNDYFSLLAGILALGDLEKVVMLDLGFLRKTMELLLMDHLQAPRKLEYLFDNFAKIWTKRRPPLGNLGAVIGGLMSLCDPSLRPCRDDETRTHYLRRLPKFPLTSTEYDFFTFSHKNQLAILTRLLESQATTENMGILVAQIVKSEAAPPEGPLLEQIKTTLISGVPVDPAQEAEPFLMCLLYFISATKSPNYVKEILRRVADEVPTIGTDGGPEHLHFFEELSNLRNPNLKQNLIRWRMIEFVGLWAPPLLTYCDGAVREKAERLLDEILFDILQDGGDRPRARKGVEDLMNGCFAFIESRFPRTRQPCDEKTFENVLRVLEKCGEYQEDEEAFRARSDGLRLLIEKIILEEEDADLASDEWGGSDIGSDTHEMEVQLDEYST